MASLPPNNPSKYARAQRRPAIALITQILRFLVSGGAATLIHWAVMGALVVAGGNPVLSTAVGAVAGSAFNYVLQFSWAFNGVARHSAAIPAYVLVVILGWALNAALYACLTLFFEIGIVKAQVFTTAIVAVMNFSVYKRIVFHERVN